jgi:hypothetical protein
MNWYEWAGIIIVAVNVIFAVWTFLCGQRFTEWKERLLRASLLKGKKL